MNITLYVQAQCSKSSEVEQLLQKLGVSVSVVDLSKNPPTPEKLIELAKKCEEPLSSLLRKNTDTVLDLKENVESCSEQELAEIMSEYPEVIERPIVENQYVAVVARPPDKILAFIQISK